jgi:hypothetical protein
MPNDESHELAPEDEKRLFWLTTCVAIVLLTILGGLSIVIWRMSNIFIMWVPIAILEWAFAGAMVSVLYRLAYRKNIKSVGLSLYTWVVAKPFIGLFMGALVYFLALAGAKLLNGHLPDSPDAPAEEFRNALWLNVVAFAGGFSDELSLDLIKRFFSRQLGLRGRDDEGASGQEPPAPTR